MKEQIAYHEEDAFEGMIQENGQELLRRFNSVPLKEKGKDDGGERHQKTKEKKTLLTQRKFKACCEDVDHGKLLHR